MGDKPVLLHGDLVCYRYDYNSWNNKVISKGPIHLLEQANKMSSKGPIIGFVTNNLLRGYFMATVLVSRTKYYKSTEHQPKLLNKKSIAAASL